MKKSKYFLYTGIFFFLFSCILLILKAYDIAHEEKYPIKQFLLISSTIIYILSITTYIIMRFIFKK